MKIRERAYWFWAVTAIWTAGCAAPPSSPSAVAEPTPDSTAPGVESAQGSAGQGAEPDAASVAGQGAAPEAASAAWQADVFGRIAAGEYAVRASQLGLEAVNRNHGLRTRWRKTGVELRPRETEQEPLLMRTVAVARGEARLAAREQEFILGACQQDRAVDELGECLKRTESHQTEWVEWWENRDSGLEQGFDFERAPLAGAADEPLRIELEIDAARIELDADGLGATLALRSGEALRYAGLAAFDAEGSPLATRLLARDGGLSIEIDERDAVYPIWVDPILTSSYALRVGDQAGARLGTSLASAGDFNCDGIGDVIIGALDYDNGQTDEGKVFVYTGTGGSTLLSTTPAWSYERNQADAGLGYAVASAGDMNGDGCGDVVVGAPFFDAEQHDEGAAFVFFGSAGALPSSPNATLSPTDQANAEYGCAVASAGHVNLDAFGDIVVGARLYDGGQNDEGRVYVHYGNNLNLPFAEASVESDAPTAQLGSSVAGGGDLDGDTFSDFIAGAPYYDGSGGQTNEGRVYVYYGGTFGPSAPVTLEANQANAEFGQSVAILGDFGNGTRVAADEGLCDIAIGAPRYDAGQTDEGRAFVYYGRSNRSFPASADWTRESDQANARFGASVASAGDFNGDGYADVMVGAPLYDGSVTDGGRAQIWSGSPIGLPGPWTPAYTGNGSQAGARFGAAVASAGDVNGDGFSDVMIGSPYYDGSAALADSGMVLAYLGARAAYSSVAAAGAFFGGQPSAGAGYAVASAGDLDADGFADVVVGVPNYSTPGRTSNGRVLIYRGGAGARALSDVPDATLFVNVDNAAFGRSVAGAGDVNGDGFDDLLVGAPGYTNGQAAEGAAYLFLGTIGTLVNTTYSWRFESGQANASFGATVASAGDLNGDGRADVLVGAPLYDGGETDEGRVYVFHGENTTAGLPAAANRILEVDKASAGFGGALASGDLDRDGLSDAIVGAWTYNGGDVGEGRVFIYKGVAGGTISSTRTWFKEPNVANALFGFSVASADVNCDGYGDLIVGAPGYTDGQQNEGRVYMYTGSSSGPSTATAWTTESNSPTANFGYSVANAGDFNADGCAEVIVGAPFYDNGQTDEGLVFVYQGGSGGLGSASWVFQNNVVSEKFGTAVAGAGDVNGDGMSEVIMGGPGLTLTSSKEGAAVVFAANTADPGQDNIRGSLRRGILALQPGSSARIAPHGRSTSPFGFDVAMRVRGPMGRTRVQLHVESKPLGTAFDGSGLLPTGWTDTTTTGTLLRRSVVTFPASRSHFRARLVYDPSRLPWFQRSLWFYGGLPGEAHNVAVATP